MIILDTNVVSEPMRRHGEPAVTAWLDVQAAETLYLTATNLAELLAWIEVLPAGRRKEGLVQALDERLGRLFGPRILAFDKLSATAYATVVGRARSAGRAMSMGDAQIAAIAIAHRFQVATRDTAPFTAVGVPVIDPWRAGGA